MSMAELGLDGLWSCIYCEGTWLSAKQVHSLLAQPSGSRALQPRLSACRHADANLTCPECEANSLSEVAVGTYKAHCCTTCHSVFLAKGILLNLCPTAGAGASGPEVAGKAFVNAVGWLLLSIVPFGAS